MRKFFPVTGLLAGTALAAAALFAPAASASTTTYHPPTEAKCYLPIVAGHHLPPVVWLPGEVSSMTITDCAIRFFRTSDGPVMQVVNPYDGGVSPLYRLLNKPQAPVMSRTPIHLTGPQTLRCTHVHNRLVLGRVGSSKSVACGLRLYQLVPHVDAAEVVLTHNRIHTNYFVGQPLRHKPSWQVPVPTA